jgi:hypothetical protein
MIVAARAGSTHCRLHSVPRLGPPFTAAELGATLHVPQPADTVCSHGLPFGYAEPSAHRPYVLATH